MKKLGSTIAIGVSLLALAGCSYSGTTYGTGTTHEAQTLKSLGNLMALSKDDQKNIDYTARPDLVMPADPNLLPVPAADTAAVEEGNWPVSPEQRIQAARAAAPEANWRSGDLPVEYLTSEKQGIRNSASAFNNPSRRGARAGGGEQLIEEIRKEANGQGTSELVRQRREQLAYSTGVKRKFLTEPPVEYRTPSANAEAGELGITKEQITEAQKKAAREKEAIDRGILIPGS